MPAVKVSTPVRMDVGVTGSIWVMLAAGVETGRVIEGMWPMGALTGSEIDGALTGSEGESALSGSEGAPIGSAGTLGALTGSEGAAARGESTGSGGALTAGALTGRVGTAADGTPSDGAPTAGWLSDRAAMEGAAIEGVLMAGTLTGSEGSPSPLVGSASTGAPTGALTAGIEGAAMGSPAGIEGAAMGSPEGMVTGRPAASIDRLTAIVGMLTGIPTDGMTDGMLTGGRLIAGRPLDGMTDGAPTSGLTEGALTPLTGSEGIAGTPERDNR